MNCCERHNFKDIKERKRYFIDSHEHNNCVLCLVDDKGSMTQEEVGRYLGLTKMRISQIEAEALRKVIQRGFHLSDEDELDESVVLKIVKRNLKKYFTS